MLGGAKLVMGNMPGPVKLLPGVHPLSGDLGPDPGGWNLDPTSGRGLLGEVGEELVSPPVLSREGLGTCHRDG